MELLLISHQGIASGIKDSVNMIMGDASNIHVIELTEVGIDVFASKLEEYLVSWLSRSKGLIFADLKGGTPFNQVELLLRKHQLKDRAKVISGMNLPVILEIMFSEIDVNDLQQIQNVIEIARMNIDCMDLQTQENIDEDE